MINRNVLIGLAAVTLVLFGVSAVVGQDGNLPLYLDEIVWFVFLACALTLVVLCVGVLVRSVSKSTRRTS